MIRANVRARFAACMACLATAGIATACHHAAPSMTAGSPPSMPQQQISAPATKQSAADPIAALVGRTDTTAEEHVSIDTHGREADVRDILTFLGQRAHVHFVFSPEINKKVRVTLDDVPVSQAILSVFSLAGLTLEGTGTLKTPPTPAVVFYEVPVNIDSLSVESIMKRFGVSRAVADVLVQARTPRP